MVTMEENMKGILLSVVAMTLVFLATPLLAAQNTGGGPAGTNFACDVNTLKCTCTGVPEGADCKAMGKNCKVGTFMQCSGGTCTCTMAATRAPSKKGPGMKVPSGSIKAQ
jgi:hypothetical protein